MTKTIVLHSSDGPVARHLKQCGYQVLDFHQARRQGQPPDAVLLAGYRPESVIFNHSDCADITIGGCHAVEDGAPFTLNITGQTPEQVQSLLESRLQRREF